MHFVVHQTLYMIFLLICILTHSSENIEKKGTYSIDDVIEMPPVYNESVSISRARPTASQRVVLIVELCSMLGYHIATKLIAKGYFVIGTDYFVPDIGYRFKQERLEDLKESFPAASYDLKVGNFCNDYNFSREVLSIYKYDYIVHLPRTDRSCTHHIIERLKEFQSFQTQLRAVFFQPERLEKTNRSTSIWLHHFMNICKTTHLNVINRNHPATSFSKSGLWYSAVCLDLPTVYGPFGSLDEPPYLQLDQILKGIVPEEEVHSRSAAHYELLFIDDLVSAVMAVVAATSTAATNQIILNLHSPDNTLLIDSKSLFQLLSANIASQPTMPYKDKLLQNKHLDDIITAEATNSSRLTVYSIKYKTSVQQGIYQFVNWHYEKQKMKIPCVSKCNYGKGGACFLSGWDMAAVMSRRFTRGCDVVIYTTIVTEKATEIHSMNKAWSGKSLSCAIVFLDWQSRLAKRLRATGLAEGYYNYFWRVIMVKNLMDFTNNRRASKIPKLTPDAFFASSVKFAIAMDSKLALRMNFSQVLDLLQPSNGDNITVLHQAIEERVLLMVVQHPAANTLFDDIRAVLRNIKDRQHITFEPEMLNSQMQYYLRDSRYEIDNYKCHENMFDSAFLVHKLQSAEATQFRCSWYREYLDWSDRDQPPGGFILSKKFGIIAKKIASSSSSTKVLLEGKLSTSNCSAWKSLISSTYLPVASKNSELYFVKILPAVPYAWGKGQKSPLVSLHRFNWNV